jgi:hypothetical protein
MHVEKGDTATKVVVLLYDVETWFYIDSFFDMITIANSTYRVKAKEVKLSENGTLTFYVVNVREKMRRTGKEEGDRCEYKAETCCINDRFRFGTVFDAR